MSPSRAILLAVLLAAVDAKATAQQGGRQDELFGKIDGLVKPLVEHGITVGLVVGVLQDGAITVRGYGRVTKEKPDLPDGNTVYEIGSITKVFTGILLADAVSRKLAALDDPVQKFLPDDVKVPKHRDAPIRLVHLTTHTSALPRMPITFRPADPRDPFADYSKQLLYQGLAEITLQRPPGQDYLYSNLGVGLLGHVVTVINRSSGYETLLHERITKPLGLADTRITLTAAMRKRLATPYTADGQPRSNWGFDVLVGCGGIRSTANDMLRFASHNLAKDDDPDLHDLRQAMAAARAPHHNPGFMKRLQGKTRVGLGWHMGSLPHTVWHNGGTGGYRTYLAIHNKKKFAVVVLANTTSSKVDELANRVFLLVLGRKVSPLRIRKAIAVDRDVLAGYVGEYRLTKQARFTITLGQDGLSARLTGQSAFRIFPTSKKRFFYRIVKAEIGFEVAEDGKVTGLVLYQHGREQRAEKID